MFIDKFYIDFEIQDYLSDDIKSDKKIIDCSLGVNPLLKGKYCDLNYSRLKETILKIFEKDMKVKIKEENISFGNGSMGTIRVLFRFLLGAGDKVLGIAPQFSRIISEVKLQRSYYMSYNLDKNNRCRFNVDEYLEKIERGIRLLYIDNPNNPTGQVINIADIEKIVKKAKNNNIFVIVDEAYGDYMENSNSSVILVNKYDNLIVVKSASKAYGLPSERIGYVIASEEIIKVYNKLVVPFPFSKEAERKFIKMLKNRKNIKKKSRKLKKYKSEILDKLDDEKYLYTDLAIPIFTINSKSKDIHKLLLEKGILAEICTSFESLDSSYVRIRISKQYKKIAKILKEVLN